jgi:hypothetical protein
MSLGDAEISAMLDMLAGDSSTRSQLKQWLLRLSQSLKKPWILEGLRVLARNVSTRSVVQLHLPRERKRKRDGFGECRVWTRMLALLLLLLKKY